MNSFIRQSAVLVIAGGCICLVFGPAMPAVAASVSLSVAHVVPIFGDAVPSDADIVVLRNNRHELSSEPYDSLVIGIITLNPALSFQSTDIENGYPVAESGIIKVNVTTENGAITAGDYITTSSTPGAGMKATRSAVVVGIALENYSDSSQKGPIDVDMQLKPTTILSTGDTFAGTKDAFSKIRDAFSLSAIAAADEPSKIIRYVIASLITLISIIFAFYMFGRTANAGVVAVGRNPGARRSIGLAVIFNVFMTLTVSFTGLALSYAILIL